MEKHLKTPITKEKIKDLKSGDYLYISGTIFTARDAAHKRMYETLKNGEELPINIKEGSIVSYKDDMYVLEITEEEKRRQEILKRFQSLRKD